MKTRQKIELYRELVPLSEAAAVAYHIITERPVALRDPAALREARGLVAIALSTVAPLLRQENGGAVPLSSPELKQRLFTPGVSPDLDGLCIRRLDLLRAIESLREAHQAFGREHVLDAIRKLS